MVLITPSMAAGAANAVIQFVAENYRKSCTVRIYNYSKDFGLLHSSKYGADATQIEGSQLPAISPPLEYQSWDDQHWLDDAVAFSAGVGLTLAPLRNRFRGVLQVKGCMVWKFIPSQLVQVDPAQNTELYLIVAVRNIEGKGNRGYMELSPKEKNAKTEWNHLDKSGLFKDSGSVGELDDTYHFNDDLAVRVRCEMDDDPAHCVFTLTVDSHGPQDDNEDGS